jgi:hypothetical protein
MKPGGNAKASSEDEMLELVDSSIRIFKTDQLEISRKKTGAKV